MEPVLDPSRTEPLLLLTLEPWHKVFFRNLKDLLWRRPQPPLEMSLQEGVFWSDVFVTFRLPWRWLAQSGVGHVVAIVALVGLARIWPQPARTLDPSVVDSADVIYYSPAEYLPALDSGGAHRQMQPAGEPEYSRQPIVSVPPEADNRTQTIVTAPDIKLDRDVPVPNIVAWSQIVPTVPLASTARTAADLKLPALPVTVIAPAPEVTRTEAQQAPVLPQEIVAPAPDVTPASSLWALQAPERAVVAPPPSLNNISTRKTGDLDIGHAEVVAPAPVLPLSEQRSLNRAAAANLGSAAAGVVPPPPSIPGTASANGTGRLIALGIHPEALAAPLTNPGGNRRGTFAATPTGKPGAAGTPDAKGSGRDTKSAGSGSEKESNGLPPGLSVAAGPEDQARSSMTGSSAGAASAPTHQGPDSSRLVADATPPRASSAATRPASEVSSDKVTDLDRQVFGDRKLYSMTLNMPNLNSAGGSWVIRFAELKENNNQGELSAPVAAQKVDPAYPLQLMRRNVQGTVTLHAVIRSDGSVADVRVLRSVDDRLDEYARIALSRWRFHPASKNGNAVDIEAVVTIPFRAAPRKSSY